MQWTVEIAHSPPVIDALLAAGESGRKPESSASWACSQQWVSCFYRENSKLWLSFSKAVELVSGPTRVQIQNCPVVIGTGLVFSVALGYTCVKSPELQKFLGEYFCHCSHSAGQKLNNMETSVACLPLHTQLVQEAVPVVAPAALSPHCLKPVARAWALTRSFHSCSHQHKESSSDNRSSVCLSAQTRADPPPLLSCLQVTVALLFQLPRHAGQHEKSGCHDGCPSALPPAADDSRCAGGVGG